jgi:hypothetical protein
MTQTQFDALMTGLAVVIEGVGADAIRAVFDQLLVHRSIKQFTFQSSGS